MKPQRKNTSGLVKSYSLVHKNILDSSSKSVHKKTVSALFIQVFDNGKGFVTEKDVRTIMLNMGEQLSEEELDDMMSELPVKSGKIKISGKPYGPIP